MHNRNEAKIYSNRRTFWISLSAIGALIFGAGALFISNRGMLDDIRAERVSSESILAERNFALQEISVLKKDVNRLIEEKELLTDTLMATRAGLEISQANNIALNGWAIKAGNLEKAVSQYQSAKFANDAASLVEKRKTEEAQQLNYKLANELEGKETEIARLSSQLDEYINKATLFDMEARRTLRGKLTVHARNTRALHIEFSLAKGTLETNEPLFLTLTDLQQGKSISGAELPVTLAVDGENITITPISKGRWEGKGVTDRMEIDVELAEKLRKGIYQVDVYTESRYLGGSRLRLQ